MAFSQEMRVPEVHKTQCPRDNHCAWLPAAGQDLGGDLRGDVPGSTGIYKLPRQPAY